MLAAVSVHATPATDDAARRADGTGLLLASNPSGMAATFTTTGSIDHSNPFFQSLGSNGRSCSSCHQASEGWTITPRGVRERFRESQGTDPIFRLNDGANSPLADVSSRAARARAYSMLLDKALIRVGPPIPDTAEFELLEVDDPYGFASARELSLFRRPLSTTNLRFINTVMWDGRETFRSDVSSDCIFGTTTCLAPLHFDLSGQSNSATVSHAQATVPLSTAQREAIVGFQMGLFTAQAHDRDAGRLNVNGAGGGPAPLAVQESYLGINDTLATIESDHGGLRADAVARTAGVARHPNRTAPRRDRDHRHLAHGCRPRGRGLGCASCFDDPHRCHVACVRARGHARWCRPPDRPRGRGVWRCAGLPR